MVLSSEAELIRANDWTRGSIIKIDVLNTYTTKDGSTLPSGDYMLISQLCDISTPPLDDEPYIELIKLHYISKIDKSFTKGRSHKKLHIAIDADNNVELRAMDRYIVKRESLTSNKPSSNANLAIADAIVSWVTKKIMRSPFPDRFNARINRGKMKKILEKCHDCVQYFMVKLNTEEELTNDDQYKVAILLIIEANASEDELAEVKVMLKKIVALLEEHTGIAVFSDYVESSDLVTLHEFAEYKEFYFDDLSWVRIPAMSITHTYDVDQ